MSDADLELLIYLDCKNRFTRDDFKVGTKTYSWDKHRWERLRRDGWIVVWRERNRTTQKYTIYTVSTKAKHLVSRIYRILLSEEDIPTSERSVFSKRDSYSSKVYSSNVDDMIKDSER
tara:strand:+ start:732 stop:1085 length:354 start_codon:yes stop_codon:yes gene_type:complete